MTLTKQGSARSQSSRSSRARALLEDWDNAVKSFVKVMPKDYKRALLQARERAAAKAVAAE